MKGATQVLWGIVGLAVVSGCRTAARVIDMPRVDLALESGNRGYLIGTPPAPTEQKTTRQMIGADVEIPSFYRAKPSGTKVSLDEVLPPETEAPDLSQPPPLPAGPVLYDVYTVQKGDSLWSIAAKPEIYGSATKWRRIYDANRNLLKTPERLKVGMTLKIPRGEGADAADEDDGLEFRK